MKNNSNILDTSLCTVLYGNDDIYLETYARTMIKDYLKLDKPLVLSEHKTDDDSVFMKSPHHFEMNYVPSQNNFIKSIVKNKNISGGIHIFILKKFGNMFKQNQLKKLLDIPSSRFIIISKNSGNIDPTILSRSVMLNLAFNQNRVNEFTMRHYDLEYNKEKSLICNIANTTTPKYETELYKLLDIITKSRNQMDIVNAIKQYCYKTFHVCIPLSQIAKLIINKFATHVKIREIVKSCSEVDHRMTISTRDILCYEQIFLRLWDVLKN